MLRDAGRPELVERHRTIERISRKIAEGIAQPVESDQRIEQLLQLVELCLRLGARGRHHGAQGRQDLQVIGLAAMFRHAALDVGIERLAGGLRAVDRVDDVGRRRSQLAALLGGARLHDDRMALRRARDVQRPANREEPALVIERMHLGFVEKRRRSLS